MFSLTVEMHRQNIRNEENLSFEYTTNLVIFSTLIRVNESKKCVCEMCAMVGHPNSGKCRNATTVGRIACQLRTSTRYTKSRVRRSILLSQIFIGLHSFMGFCILREMHGNRLQCCTCYNVAEFPTHTR